MPDAAFTAPAAEAVIRSPLGEVRVWIEPGPDGESRLRTSLRADYEDDANAVRMAHDLARVAAAVGEAARRLTSAAEPERAETSSVSRWLAERCETSPGYRVAAADLFRDFLHWCDANGAPVRTQAAFGKELGMRGFHRAGKTGGGLICRGGLRIKPGPVALVATPGLMPAPTPSLAAEG